MALPFDEPERFAAADFIDAPSNAAARAALAAPENWVNRRLVLWGEAGSGKSHLVWLWAARTGAQRLDAARLRAPASPGKAPLVIEDIDAAAAPLALFATLERATQDAVSVLMTCRTPPARLPIEPPDLASRLRASLTIRIEPAEPALLDTLLHRLAAARQMNLSPALHQFMLNRLPRRPAVLREAIARLDRYALALGTAPSRRIAERLIDELADPDEETADTDPTIRAPDPPAAAITSLL
ncbi:MAG: DNA replication protein [Acidiphilium sp. 37-67-22]|nr:MAG: DNA replication protein [Acidiphilium sp. 37-67-22]